MARLTYSQLARQDVDDIYDYIGERDGRPSTADKFVLELDQMCQSYAEAFAAGSAIGTARPDLGENYRVFSHLRWVVIFRPIPQGIEVLRVIDGRRDYGLLFSGI